MAGNSTLGKIFSALRMGVTPSVALEQLIVGRAAEARELNHFIHNVSEQVSGVKFLNGDYGTGKSFMLSYVKETAVEEGFIVASLSINSGFNMSKLDVFYTNIMNNLHVTSKEGIRPIGFEDLFTDWVSSIKKQPNAEGTKTISNVIQALNVYNNAFATVLTIYIRAIIKKDTATSHIAASWIKGDRNISYELKKLLKVKGSVDINNAMDIFKGFVKLINLMGYKGLIVTMDEGELMMQPRSDIRMRSYSNVRYILDACGNNELERCGFVIAGTNQLFYNEEKGFPSYDALKQRLGENIASNNVGFANVRQPVMHLRPLGEDDFKDMGRKLRDMHESFYEYTQSVSYDHLFLLVMVECKKEYGESFITMRYFIKKMIELLDLAESQPDLPIFKANMKR